MTNNTKKDLKPIRNRSFLNKDFNDFRSQLLDYAKVHFPDRIQDFSESSLGGLFLDMAAYVGDTMSFYLDHQFRELDPETAVERLNIERLARNAGIKIEGAAPAVAGVTFIIKVPSEKQGLVYQPQTTALPTIKKNSIVESDNDITFSLVEDIDFSETNEQGKLLADLKVFESNTDGSPKTYLVSRVGQCVSGERVVETVVIPDTFLPFRTTTLSNADVSEVIDVRDLEGNIYYEVDSLSQDTVFKATSNLADDNKVVGDSLSIIPAPYRFVKETTTTTGLTTLRFGSGRADILDGDIIPDPSDLALPLFGRRTFSKFTIDPSNLLKTKTLGISPTGTTLTIQYRSGGGLDNNVSSESILTTSELTVIFPGAPSARVAGNVRASFAVVNEQPAAGGEDAITIEEIRAKIGSARNMQNRIVTKQDLLARIYMMPSNFGRVFRAGVSKNSRNPLATNLYITNRDASGYLIISPDTLKKNLTRFLNEFRLVSDAIDILDAKIVNIGIDFEIVVDPNFNAESVMSKAIDKLISYMNIENFQIGQPIRVSDLNNLVYNIPGVVSVIDIKFVNKVKTDDDSNYSNVIYNLSNNTRKGILYPPEGGIFEVKNLDIDIRGTAS